MSMADTDRNISPTVELTQTLIRRESVSPNDAGCQDLLIDRLEPLGFRVERMPFGDTDNLWLRKGTDGPVFAFAGHTDVVPAGPSEAWESPPFFPEIRGEYLYGRGAADMKGSLAAMVTALERFLAKHSEHRGSIALLITSDEEAATVNGTIKAVELLEARGEKIQWCLVGEPSSHKCVGDVIKNGRRGSLHCKLVVEGIQGHVAYPHLAKNPVHQIGSVITALTGEVWDHGNDFFPPTSLQIYNIQAGVASSDNVIPGVLHMGMNFRFCPEVTAESLRLRTEKILNSHQLDYQAKWRLSGEPFLTADGALLDAVAQSVKQTTGISPQLSTSGGTSDGRHIAPTGAEVIELGPCNQTIHKVNECVKVSDLDILSDLYHSILVRLMGKTSQQN